MEYKSKKHWFWEKYENEEPHTLDIFKKYMKPTYIDIGAWIGSTIFYAKEAGAKNIFAIEANPESFKHLIYNCEVNCIKANLLNKCIYNESGKIIKFGRSTSSNSTVEDSEFDTMTITYRDYIKSIANNNSKFIKIDIEGYEENIIDDLSGLVYLSLHPTFWKKNKLETINKLERFKIKLAKTDQIVPFQTLKKMLLSEEKYPEWGTIQGNFFEVLICG